MGALKISPLLGPDVDDPLDAGVWATIDDEISLSSGSANYQMINEESPGTAAPGGDGSAPSASQSVASGTYTVPAANMPPEPPLPSVPSTHLRQQAEPENPQHPS